MALRLVLGGALARSGCALARSAVRPMHSSVAALAADVASAPASWSSEESTRVPVLAIKCGMTCDWNEWGERIPLTVLAIDGCQVVQSKPGGTKQQPPTVQIGCSIPKAKRVSKPQAGHFLSKGVPPKRMLREFKVSPDALLPPGTELTARHFVPGQFVDVQGTSIGKGFQGVIKRWNFNRQPETHGNSTTTRAHGSTGSCQDPGKVWKGKKMAGQLGNETATSRALQVYKIDPARNLLYVKGSVVGHKGNYVVVKDTTLFGKRWGTRVAAAAAGAAVPPFPAFVAPAGERVDQLQPLVLAPPQAEPEALSALK